MYCWSFYSLDSTGLIHVIEGIVHTFYYGKSITLQWNSAQVPLLAKYLLFNVSKNNFLETALQNQWEKKRKKKTEIN